MKLVFQSRLDLLRSEQMGLPSSRFLLFHRLFLLPPFVLLTLTCMYASSTLSPFSAGTQHLSFLQDMQCVSCESSSSLPYRSFLSRTLATFPTSLHIKDFVLRHDLLNVKNSSSGETKAEVSRRHTNEVESVDHGLESNEVDGAVSGDDAEDENTDTLVPAAETTVDNAIPSDDNVDISVSGDSKNIDSSVQEQDLENSEVSGRIEEVQESSVPADTNVDSSVEIVEFSSETQENFGGDSEEDLRLESRHPTSDDHTPMEIKVSVDTEMVPAPPPAGKPELPAIQKSRYEALSEYERRLQTITDKLAKSGLPPNEEDFDVNVPLRGGSPQGVSLPEERSCEGRHAYVYTLPSKFNVDLSGKCDLIAWMNVCDYLKNEGMGPNVATDELNDRGEKVLVPDGSWFLTHQYALEVTFHVRLKHYRCITTDVNQADLFFVPYYAGLDVARYQHREGATNDQQDELMLELMSWLEGQETWSRNNGIDHVFVLGKIGWDFRRVPGNTWGSKFLRLPAMDKPTKVLIERDPWHEQDIGVPHPTFFHPKDDNEIRTWLAHVEQSERRHLVSFAGMPRPNMLGNIRGHLIEQCLDHPDDCSLLRCVQNICLRPDQTMNLFLHSHFCMQPNGDSPTRRSVFDSLVGGCIPVLFDPLTAYVQYPWHLPRNMSSFSVYIPSDNVMSGMADIVAILKSITLEERTAMRTRIIREIIPGLLYSQPGTKHSDFRDAFDISIEALFRRVANLRAEKKFM